MSLHPDTALGILFALFVYLWTFLQAGQARRTSGLQAPAMTGDVGFERAYRVQMNTLEQLILFLPALWIFGAFVSPRGALLLALVWSVARVVYGLSYVRAPASRGAGFGVALLVTVALLLADLVRAIFIAGFIY